MLFLRKNQLYLMILCVVTGVIVWANVAHSDSTEELDSINIYSLKIDEVTLSRGYTASIFEDNFKVGIFPEVLTEATDIVFKEFTMPEKFLPLPNASKKKIISHIFEFDIKNPAAFNSQKPLIIEIKYPENSVNLKKINFWDKGKGEWRELPSKNIVDKNVIRAPLHLPYARLAVFEDPNIMEVGTASWYTYKFCDCAASPDWPIGTRLKVTDLEDLDFVVVTVNDYGPDRSIHPDRVIDLDVVAFKKIAPKWLGLIKVKVERL